MAPISPDIPGFVRLIVERLKAAGHEAYVVGGAVRDVFLNRPVKDWDVVTSALAGTIKSIFQDQRQFALRHDTVTLIYSNAQFEVTPFRGAENDLFGDLSRRDFTIDAMAFELDESKVIDPFHGESDIRRRVLRGVGNPRDRFQEDPLRLLRCIRLAAELRFRIDTETRTALSETAPLLSSVAPERTRDELMKILMTPRPSRSFYLMARTGILESFLPELIQGYLKRQNHYHRYTIFRHILETVDHVEQDPVLRLAALLHDIAKPRTRIKKGGEWRFYGHEEEGALLAEQILTRLRLSKEVTRRATHLIRHHMIGYDSAWSDAAIRRLMRRVGTENIHDLLALRRADLLAHGLTKQDLVLTDELEQRVAEQIRRKVPTGRSDLAVDGNMVMEITGLSAGPAVGRVLRELNEKVLDHPELNNREDLTAILKFVAT